MPETGANVVVTHHGGPGRKVARDAYAWGSWPQLWERGWSFNKQKAKSSLAFYKVHLTRQKKAFERRCDEFKNHPGVAENWGLFFFKVGVVCSRNPY